MILSRALYSFLGLILGFVLFMVFIQDAPEWRWGILPVLALGFLTYIFSSELNHYWLNRYPIEVDEREHIFISRHLSFYASLSPDKQKEFGKQCIQFHRKRDYILQSLPNFPDDLKVLWSAQALVLSYALDLAVSDWDEFDTVVVYPHPFMTPNVDEVHASETHFDEGVWLFSVDQLIPGMTKPHRFFNIALYEFVRTAKKIRPERFAALKQFDASELEAVSQVFSNINFESIRYWLNIDDFDREAAYYTLLLSHWSVWEVFSEQQKDTLPLAREVSSRLRSNL
jgi:hypothetical protein